jgi:hypothetical protein
MDANATPMWGTKKGTHAGALSIKELDLIIRFIIRNGDQVHVITAGAELIAE